ncbi:MAG TPA: hypothetical protein VJ846_03880 [Sphingomicrobium sp.]|nr:hypothetical protein [Sphingomicrobium sp.]
MHGALAVDVVIGKKPTRLRGFKSRANCRTARATTLVLVPPFYVQL